MGGCICGGIKLMEKIKSRWDQPIPFVHDVFRCVGVHVRIDKQSGSCMRVVYQTHTLLHTAFGYKLFHYIQEIDPFVKLGCFKGVLLNVDFCTSLVYIQIGGRLVGPC